MIIVAAESVTTVADAVDVAASTPLLLPIVFVIVALAIAIAIALAAAVAHDDVGFQRYCGVCRDVHLNAGCPTHGFRIFVDVNAGVFVVHLGFGECCVAHF